MYVIIFIIIKLIIDSFAIRFSLRDVFLNVWNTFVAIIHVKQINKINVSIAKF